MNDSGKVEFYKDCRDFGSTNMPRRLDLGTRIIHRLVHEVRPQVGSQNTDPEWTRAILTSLAAICPQDCCHAPAFRQDFKKCRIHEFLVDFIWEEEAHPNRILLACESEWSSDKFGKETNWAKVEEDFEKLLVIKAPFKLLVFSSNSQPNQSDDSDRNFIAKHAKCKLEDSLKRYGHHLPGETYIFVDFPYNSGRTDTPYRSFTWQSKEMALQNVKLEEGPTNLVESQ
jgi:hypothetical protein